MSALVCPHLGVCLWLWLGVAVGLGQRQGKDVAGVLPGKVAPVRAQPQPRPHPPGAQAPLLCLLFLTLPGSRRPKPKSCS